MKTGTNKVKQAIQGKLASQLKTAEAKLDELKARAEAAKADAETRAIGELRAKNRVIKRKLHQLGRSGEHRWEQAKSDLETQVAEFEKSVKGIGSRIKGH
jgi:outer membrane murein-binding lipoprotein Lpp